jgi:hypothetical protein
LASFLCLGVVWSLSPMEGFVFSTEYLIMIISLDLQISSRNLFGCYEMYCPKKSFNKFLLHQNRSLHLSFQFLWKSIIRLYSLIVKSWCCHSSSLFNKQRFFIVIFCSNISSGTVCKNCFIILWHSKTNSFVTRTVYLHCKGSLFFKVPLQSWMYKIYYAFRYHRIFPKHWKVIDDLYDIFLIKLQCYLFHILLSLNSMLIYKKSAIWMSYNISHESHIVNMSCCLSVLSHNTFGFLPPVRFMSLYF